VGFRESLQVVDGYAHDASLQTQGKITRGVTEGAIPHRSLMDETVEEEATLYRAIRDIQL
jgi:hypothetical protein